MKCSYRFLLGAAIAILAAASLGNSAMAQKQGGTLVMIVQPEPPTLASYLSTSGPIGQVAAKVYDGLLEYDTELQLKPSLAESWTVSPDGKTITFKLRKRCGLPRRHATHLSRRAVLDHEGGQGDAPARPEHLPRGDRGADAGRLHRRAQALGSRTVHDDGFLQLRDADHP